MLAIAEDQQPHRAQRLAGTIGTNQLNEIKEVTAGEAVDTLPQNMR